MENIFKFVLQFLGLLNQRTQKKPARAVLNYWQGQATVHETIYPFRKGWVLFRSTLWQAQCEDEVVLNSGDMVEVKGHQNLTLIVTKSSSSNNP